MASTIFSAAGPKPLPIIHLNGFPGTGKLTIARKLVEQLNRGFGKQHPSDSARPARAKLVHNHLLIDPAAAVLERKQEGYNELRTAIRQAVFTTLVKESSTYDTIYVFTDWQSGNVLGTEVCKEYLTMAKARGSQFIPILITCDEQENVRRIQGVERAISTKLTDSELLVQWRQEVDPPPVYLFSDEKARLELDVTSFKPEQAAEAIWKHASQYVPEGR
jgi:adenylate kinase family enzyme